MIEVTEVNGVLVAKFTNQDRFNSLISEPVKETLLAYFNKPNSKLILDLAGIKFIDSSGFSVFLSIMKVANNNYGEFKICNIAPEVKELFQLLQLHNIFDIHDTLEECISSFK
jgi:anti-sigma B factor antagonist